MTERIDLGRRGLIAGAVAAMTAPAWLSTAFAAEAGPTTREKELFQAWHKARRAGTKLLVVVVPADDGEKWDRGRHIGATLNHASPELLAILSGYQPACATLDELRGLGVTVSGEPWFVVVEAGDLPRSGHGIDGPAEPVVEETTEELRFGPSDATVDAWIDAIDTRLVAALGPVPEAVDVAARAGKARWLPERLPGSHWAISGGCGMTIEDYEDNVRFGCGMGHVPAKARRMLYFFEPGTN